MHYFFRVNIMILIQAIFIGVLATLFMDIIALLQKQLLNVPSLDYRLVGRWLIGMTKGKFSHQTILQTPPTKGGKTIGWVAHYLIGVIFAVLLISIVKNITLLSALLMGLLTVVFPFFIMQPAFGFGILAANTPAPNTARLRSLIAHLTFGFGLYLASSIFNGV